MSKVFAVIYRFYLLKEKEEEYFSCWKALTKYYTEKKGAISSTLHKADEGYFVAYSKWPDRKTRDACWPTEDESLNIPLKIKELIGTMKNCADLKRESFPEVCMELIEETSSYRFQEKFN